MRRLRSMPPARNVGQHLGRVLSALLVDLFVDDGDQAPELRLR
jgi:hypothetical protein